MRCHSLSGILPWNTSDSVPRLIPLATARMRREWEAGPGAPAGLPWTLMRFWNSVIGFVIARIVSDPAGYTNPCLRAAPNDSPITARTAICLAVRHEEVGLVMARLETMVESIAATAWADRFSFHLLSDSSRPEVVAAEEQGFAALTARHPRGGFLHYRRRAGNT